MTPEFRALYNGSLQMAVGNGQSLDFCVRSEKRHSSDGTVVKI